MGSSCDCIKVSFTYDGVDYEFGIPKIPSSNDYELIIDSENSVFIVIDEQGNFYDLYISNVVGLGITTDYYGYFTPPTIPCPSDLEWEFFGGTPLENLTITECPQLPCNCYKIIPSCTTELEYIDCDGVTQYILIEDGLTYNVCSQIQPIFACIGALVTNLGECVDGLCPELDCQCYETTISELCDGKTLTYVDCDLNTVSFVVSGNQTYNFCSVIEPTINCKSFEFTLKGNCVNGECPTPPVVCICNKVTNTTNETQTYCYIDCDSNQQSITLQPGESSDKICVSAWTECITCDCLEGTFNSSGVDINFKFEKTNQIKNGKPVYYSYIIYNNDYSQYGRYTLTFELDNCWYAIPDTNFYEFVGPSFTLCENIDCPIGVWQKIECSCLNSTFTTPDIGFGLNFYITSIDENGYAIFKTSDSNYKIIYNILLVRWEFIEVSTESLIAYYVTDSQCPYTGIFSPVNWTTIDLNNSFSLDGFADCFENFSTIKCEPKCDCINIILTVSPYGSPVYYSTLLTPTGNIVNSKPEYTLVFINNSEFLTVNWNSITNCWELIDDTLTVLATLCDSSDPNCPIGNWEIVPGKDFNSMSSNYCIDSILPENIENFGDCIDGQCPTIPVTTTTTTFFPPPPIPIQPKNECDPLTIFPLGVECFSIEPTYSDSFDGVVGLGITGGTPPYTILWNTGSVAPAIFNVGVGEYKATVTDYYKDFTATTTCILTAITTTTTTTILPVTTTQKTYNDFCLISTVRDGDVIQERNVDLIYNGFYNGYPSWTSVTDNLFVYWSADTTNLWIINGIPNISAINNTYNEPTIGEPLPFNNWQVLGTFSPKIQIDIRIVPGPCSNVNEPTISVIKNDPTCECNGSISVQVNGGTPPYQYSIDGGLSYQSNPVFQNLCSGGYSTFVKDSNDFVDSQFITLVGTTITPITLTLQYTGPNSFEIITSPALSPGTSISFILTHSNSFTKQPASSTQIYNNVVTLLKNSIVIPPSVGPVITTTNLPVVGPCSVFGKLKTDTTTTWQNITITAGDIITGTFTDSVSTLIPIPQCYSEPLKSRSLALTLGNVDDCLQQYITVINPPQDFGLQITGPFIP